MLNDRTNILKELAHKELVNNILPYWENYMVDHENGGFYGSIDFFGHLDKKASKGAVLNTRILWTFSKAYNVLGEKKYLDLAQRAYEYIDKNFRDHVNNGVFWELDYTGKPVNTQKYCYTQGFWIYALSEYYKATKDKKVLDQAMSIFEILEDKALDKARNGYVEAFASDWTVTGNVRLSEKDLNENKTYNTHLHILEAYAALYRVSKNVKVGKALENLILLMIEKFYNPANGHFRLFFDDDWNVKGDLISFGHDIEGSWLLWDAIESLGNEHLREKYEKIVLHIADVAAIESIDDDGGQYYEGNSSGLTDTDKHWWPQAETLVGFVNAYQITVNDKYLDLAMKTWNFIEKYIIDRERGEWNGKVTKDRTPITTETRAGFWKCPYHNSRACFEIMQRLNQ
jgi:mannobiose 2-epimerase